MLRANELRHDVKDETNWLETAIYISAVYAVSANIRHLVNNDQSLGETRIDGTTVAPPITAGSGPTIAKKHLHILHIGLSTPCLEKRSHSTLSITLTNLDVVS